MEENSQVETKPKRATKKRKPTVKPIQKIKIQYAYEILASDQFYAALKKEINGVIPPPLPEGKKYKSNGVIQLLRENKLLDIEWMINEYTEILAKKCNLSAEKRGLIKYLCDKAFFAVKDLFEVQVIIPE